MMTATAPPYGRARPECVGFVAVTKPCFRTEPSPSCRGFSVGPADPAAGMLGNAVRWHLLGQDLVEYRLVDIRGDCGAVPASIGLPLRSWDMLVSTWEPQHSGPARHAAEPGHRRPRDGGQPTKVKLGVWLTNINSCRAKVTGSSRPSPRCGAATATMPPVLSVATGGTLPLQLRRARGFEARLRHR
jgi:hypothetical protein